MEFNRLIFFYSTGFENCIENIQGFIGIIFIIYVLFLVNECLTLGQHILTLVKHLNSKLK